MELSKELLEEMYVNQNLKQREIAERFNIDQKKIGNILKKYNIYKYKNTEKAKNNKKAWTKEELKILVDNFGKLDFEQIGKKIGRTAKAVQNKKNRLGLGDTLKYTEYITAKDLGNALGVASTTVRTWIIKKGLVATYKATAFNQKFYRIKVSNFWSWARKNPKYMRWELYERGSLGKEPSWLDAEIKKYNAKEKVNRKLWSKTDLCYLTSYYKNGMSLDEISKKLNRTKDATYKKLKMLGIFCKKNFNVPWRDEETEILKKMRSQGKTLNEIAEELGRSMSVVSAKCQLYNIKKGKSINNLY